MPAVKDILKHVRVDVAGKRRKRNRKRDHVIAKGDACLVVRDGAQRQSTYCTTCAADILAKADSSLKDLHTHIGTPSEHGQAE